MKSITQEFSPRPARLRKALVMSLGLSVAALAPSFALAQTFPGSNLGAIPDNDPVTGLSTTFNVSGVTGSITDLNVSVTFSPAHTWAGDITATLIAPGGSPSVTLVDRIGFPAATFGDSSDLAGPYLFVDPADGGADIWAAAATADGATAIPSGTYFSTSAGSAAPTPLVSPFAALTPAQINGTWTLKFTDSGAGDTGSVSATSLSITAPPPIPPSVKVDTLGTLSRLLLCLGLLGAGLLVVRLRRSS